MADRKQLQLRLSSHLEATDAQIDAFLLNVERLVTAEMRKRLKKLRGGKATPQLLAKHLGSLVETLEAAGLGEQVKKLRRIYEREVEFVDEQLARQDIDKDLTATDKSIIETMIDFDVSQVTRKIEAHVEEARSTLIRSVFLGQDPDFEAVAESLGSRLGTLTTELTTLTMGFSRAVTARKAEAVGIEELIYLGPNDKLTRPFCNGVLGRSPAIYTVEEIGAMDNGQGLDVLTFGGGYNCRHSWQPVSPELAEELRGKSR